MIKNDLKVGFVTLLGRPNAGKSTLLNAILNYKVSITSSTPQTTRDQIRGIYNDKDSQIIFIDTPGIHKPKQILGEKLNRQSYKSLEDIDLILFLQPANEKIGPGDRYIIDKIKNKNKKVAIITKVDLNNDAANLNSKAKELKSLGFELVLGVSSEYNFTIDDLLKEIKNFLPIGHKFYEDDYVTDVSVRFITKELIRESAINLLSDEIPHALGVVVDEFDEQQDLIEISATIFVARNSQKGIIIGANGALIKEIGINSRKKIEKMVDKQINLKLLVKVDKNWTNNITKIKQMGY